MTADLHHLAAAYALNALSTRERRAFEAHYPDCGICGREVAEFRETAAALAEGVVVEPPEAMRARVLAQVSQTRQLHRPVTDIGATRRRGGQWKRGLVGLAAGLLLVVGGVAVASRSGADQTEFAALVEAPDAIVTALDPTNAGSTDPSSTDPSSTDPGQATVQVIWSAELGTLAVLASGLDELGQDETYALWLLSEAGPVPAGLFIPSETGEVHELQVLGSGEPTGWGITIEPVGGSDAPTTEVLYAGSV